MTQTGNGGGSQSALDAATLPGLVIEITSLAGGTGTNGNFLVNDTMSVTFTVELGDGTHLPLGTLDSASIMVSGPTFNYQRVIASQSDLRTASVLNPDNSYTYTFSTPIPATYLPPYNDTPSFGLPDGELQGQPLLDGTYTVGIEAYKFYEIGLEEIRDPANEVEDFLFGAATTLDIREVVKQDNCNLCHTDLRVHGTFRRSIRLCVLCHTAGAEDKNEPTAAGGTPGVSIDMKVMTHKIHSGAHLPSVLGVATNPDGSRNYTATPQNYQVVGYRNSVHDFSHIAFPIWPNLSAPLPRDWGYSSLTSTEQGLENSMRTGAATCAKCHGDPDGSGPATPPAQGNLAYTKPGRMACGSCHDDIDWAVPYQANRQMMPAQPDDSKCTNCHRITTLPQEHLHPLNDPGVNPGVVFEIAGVFEAGTNNNGNGKFDPGEKMQVRFTIKDEKGVAIDPSELARVEMVIAGPTTNRNILVEQRLATAVLSGTAHEINVPVSVFSELCGTSTGSLEQFTTALAPHWDVSGAQTTVLAGFPRESETWYASTLYLTAAAKPMQNFIDVADAVGIRRGDYIVIDGESPTKAEYLRVQLVDGNRLWFSSTHSPYDQTALRYAHAANAPVWQARLTEMVAGTDYTLDPLTGTVTELREFGIGASVLVSYTTDWVVPDVYPTALNESPALGEMWGNWTGKPLVDGTYTLSMWGERPVRLELMNETNSYNGVSVAANADFLVGSATTLQPARFIDSGATCLACHDDIYFHGSHRRGFDSCIVCHGTAGSEDRPRYVAANAPATDDVTIDFRNMLHKIHMGAELTNPSTWAVVGYGSGYPNNFTAHTYELVGFPSMLGGAANCVHCHGASNNAWKLPSERTHPTDQLYETRSWFVVCGSCHDDKATHAHIDLQTTLMGVESCTVCHGLSDEKSVEAVHKHQ